jgi:hypothetical protein
MTLLPTNSNTMVVAFCGAKRHGKDTAAKVLIEQLGFTKVSFADGLRKTVATALRVNERYFLDDDKKEEIDWRTGQPRRYWLQWIGSEGFRKLWEDVWVEWWRQEIEDKGYDRVVTTDLRFPNELAAVRKFQHNLVIRVENPNKPVGDDVHVSEAHYQNFDVDYTILNNGTIPDLHKAVKRVFQAKTPPQLINSVLDLGYNND